MGYTFDSLESGFRAGLEQLLEEMPALDGALGRLSWEDAAEYGKSAARQALAPLIWRTMAGEVLSTEQARELLGVSRQALHKRVARGTLLGLPGERTTLFPVWQFSDGQVRPVVVEVLRAFRERLGDDVDPQIILAWAAEPQPELRDEHPGEWIRTDRDAEPALLAAERAAEALAR